MGHELIFLVEGMGPEGESYKKTRVMNLAIV